MSNKSKVVPPSIYIDDTADRLIPPGGSLKVTYTLFSGLLQTAGQGDARVEIYIHRAGDPYNTFVKQVTDTKAQFPLGPNKSWTNTVDLGVLPTGSYMCRVEYQVLVTVPHPPKGPKGLRLWFAKAADSSPFGVEFY